MTVSELIEKLSAFPADMLVGTYRGYFRNVNRVCQEDTELDMPVDEDNEDITERRAVQFVYIDFEG